MSSSEMPIELPAEVMAATIAGLQAELAAERAAAAAKVAALEGTLTDLAHENALLKRRLFGTRGERSVTSELQLALGDLLASEEKLQADLDGSVERRRTPRPHRRRPRAKASRARTDGAICSRASCRGCPSRFATRRARPRARG